MACFLLLDGPKKMSTPHYWRDAKHIVLPLSRNSSLPTGLSQKLCRRYSRSPIFGVLVKDFGTWLYGQEYAPTTIINLCRHINHLERWLRDQHRVASIAAVTPAMLVAADDHFRPLKNAYRHFTCVALHRFLHQSQLIPEPKPIKPSPSQKEVGCYKTYLRDLRGLSVSTIQDRCRRAASFLDYIDFDHERTALSELQLGRVEQFIKREAKKSGRSNLCQVASALRGFLRFEFQSGKLPHSLHEHIETPLVYADEKLPPVLTRDQVQALLRSIDQKSPHGLRDFAMIYLIAAYGLRRSEVVALTLDDINWRGGILRIKQAKTKRVVSLPLTDGVGSVLVRYLRKGRPRTQRRDLFLKSRAPMGPYSPASLRDILQKRLRQGGLDFGRLGTHAMRHSLAVHLLRRGVPMKSIGDTLGHRSIKSTTTYLRLNLDDLRSVGLPVPLPTKAEPLLESSWRNHAPKDPNEKRGGGIRPHAKKHFRSAFAQDIERFLATRRTLGRKYYTEEFTLRAWDAFLYRKKANTVNRALFDQWADKQCHLLPRTQSTKLNVVRRCLAYATRVNPGGFVPNAAEFPKRGPIRPPRLVSVSEMSSLLATAGELRNGKPWLRHTTAIHLLRTGVDLSTIARLLGHAHLNTTNNYISLGVEDKRKALAKSILLPKSSGKNGKWRQKPDLIAWLENL